MTEVGRYNHGSIKIVDYKQHRATMGNVYGAHNIKKDEVKTIKSKETSMKKTVETERRRTAKWMKMLHQLATQGKYDEKMKRRGRKGIPNSMRSISWPLLAQSKTVIPPNY